MKKLMHTIALHHVTGGHLAVGIHFSLDEEEAREMVQRAIERYPTDYKLLSDPEHFDAVCDSALHPFTIAQTKSTFW